MSNIFDDNAANETQQNNSKKSGKVRDWAYYQNLRRTAPKQYYRTSVQKQMVADRLELGKSQFYADGGKD